MDWKAAVGLGVSGVFLWIAFRDVHFAEVLGHIRQADLPLLLLATLLVTLPFPLRALRWRPLLRPVYAGTRFRPRFAATCIGFMTNNVLPARVGEFARAFALSRLEPIRVSASFGSIVVERIFDGVLVVLLLLGSLTWPSFPNVSGRDFGTAALWMGGLFVVAFVFLFAMVVRPEASVRLFETTIARLLPGPIRRPVVDALDAFLDGLGALRDGRLVLEIGLWSLLVWTAPILGMWAGMHAFGIQLPIVAAIFLNSIIALAVALPSAPGFFGVFEAAARVGLVEIWGVGASPALAFAIGIHIAGFIPVTVLGFYYLWRIGLSWRDVERSEDAVESAVESLSGGPGRQPDMGQ